jgi:hypothetical protein
MKYNSPSPRGDNSKRIEFSKIFISITSKPILIKLGTKHPCVKAI